MRLFRDEAGITTISMVVSLLLTLALIFSSAQVYRINSLSSEVQNVADASALAALDVVAEYMIVVRVCDAVVLSMTLTSVVASGIGVVASCVPAASAVGKTLTEVGKSVGTARDKFADAVSEGLDELQKALPFIAAANAAALAQANNRDESNYVAIALLCPLEGEEISVADDEEADEAQDSVDEEVDGLAEEAEEAEEAAEEANALKEEAFEADCGANPSYCMYERASSLAGMSGSSNPLYTSVDAWSFSVALERAQDYYAARLAQEEPEGSSVEEQARSALREDFYAYAVEQLDEGYVEETDDSFDAYFPQLPKNTSEMRETTLYTDAVYPVSTNEDGTLTMHAYSGCPSCGGVTGYGSLEQLEAGLEDGSYVICEDCDFRASSLGKVASATSSVETGFEYHYDIVADAAEDYEAARDELDPLKSSVKSTVSELFDQLKEAISSATDKRIEATPPGSNGVVVVVANVGESAPSTNFESSFVQATGNLGVRVAISAATLVEDPSGEGDSVISSLLDGLADESGVAGAVVDGADIVLECWSALLAVYSNGQEAIIDAVEEGLNSLPLISESGLGTWAADELEELVSDLGLEPADLDALKPALVNSAHVLAASDGDFAAQLLQIKQAVIESPDSSDGGLGSLVDALEGVAIDEVSDLTDSIEIATFELYDGGPSCSIEIALPQAVQDAATDVVSQAFEQIGEVVAGFVEGDTWE